MRNSFIHLLKHTAAAFRFLVWDCERGLARARRAGDPELLTRRRSFYAIERRLLDYLAPLDGPARLDGGAAVVREAFGLMREALVFLRDGAGQPAARMFNRRLNTLEKLGGAVELRSYPIRCYFELTNRCNLRCPMCGQQHITKEQRRDVSPDEIGRVSPLFQWMDDVSLFGYGESLLVDHVADVLDAIPASCSSSLISNGLLLNEKNGRMLADHGLSRLTISLDAVRPETFEAIRGVDKLPDVQENIRRLAAYKREKGLANPEISLAFTAMRRNIAELPDFVRMAKDLGVNAVGVGYLAVFSENMREQSLFYDQALSDRFVAEAELVAQSLGVRFSGPEKFGGRKEGAAFPRCLEPWEFIYFRSNGSVSPCCIGVEMFDSWRTSDLWDYWNGPQFQLFRRALRVAGSPESPSDCLACLYRGQMGSRDEANHVRILFDAPGDASENAKFKIQNSE